MYVCILCYVCSCVIQLVTFIQAQFNHMGTISEYLHHLCDNYVLRRAYKFNLESVDKDKSEGKQTTLHSVCNACGHTISEKFCEVCIHLHTCFVGIPTNYPGFAGN